MSAACPKALAPLFFLISLCFTLTACTPAQIQEKQAFVFGTKVEVIVVGESPALAERAIDIVLREFDRLHRLYHAWSPSALTTVNLALQAGEKIMVDREMGLFLLEAQSLSKQSEYLFDPGIGALIRQWGFHSDRFEAQIPSDAEQQAWLAHPASIQHLTIRPHGEGFQLHSHHPALLLDLGGYLKGAALDTAAELLKANGIQHALINIGGNLMALGNKSGRPWRVAIQHPRKPGPVAFLDLRDGEAIGTSGDYQRFFEFNEQRYSHLIDPRQARPAQHTQAVTILIPSGDRSGTRSDAASKPVFIAGPADWLRMSRQMAVRHVLRVDQTGKLFATPEMAQRLHLAQDAPPLTITPWPDPGLNK